MCIVDLRNVDFEAWTIRMVYADDTLLEQICSVVAANVLDSIHRLKCHLWYHSTSNAFDHFWCGCHVYQKYLDRHRHKYYHQSMIADDGGADLNHESRHADSLSDFRCYSQKT